MLGVGAEKFSVLSFRTKGDYNYAPGGHAEFNVIYLLAGLLLPLLVPCAVDAVKGRLIRKKSQ